MKVFNKLCLVLTVFLIIGSAYTVNCQTASDETTVEDKAPIPDNTDMGLEAMNKLTCSQMVLGAQKKAVETFSG